MAIIDSFLSRSREHDKWITEQRQERYAELVRAAEGVYRVQTEVMEEAKGRDITGPLRDSIHERLEAARVEMDLAQLQLQLVASPRLVEKGDAVAGWSGSMWELFDWPKGQAIEYDDLRDRRFNYELIEDFIAAARRELGAGSDHAEWIRMWFRRQRYRLRSWRDRHGSPSQDGQAEEDQSSP